MTGHKGTVGRSLADSDMLEQILRSEQEAPAERKKRKKQVCSRCQYYGGDNYESRGGSTCDYLLITGHSRPCAGVDCVREGVFKPKEGRKGWQGNRRPYGA